MLNKETQLFLLKELRELKRNNMTIGIVSTILNRDQIILNQVKKNKSVVFGSQSVEKQISFFLARKPKDFDVKSKNPKKSANQLKRTFNERSSSNAFFSRESFFRKGTHKVIFKGKDNIPNTDDDVGIADFSKLKRNNKFINIGGVNFIDLNETLKDKKRVLKNKKFTFRFQKDKSDIQRINEFKRLNKSLRGR